METLGRALDSEILVVDDVPANLVAIEAALEGLSKGLVLATSGQDALRYLLDRDFALILLDVQMPGMNGLETAQMIRQRERSRHVPIIFVTAYDSDDDDILAAYRLGAVDFLFKPIHAEVLRAKASVFVELQRRTAQVARQALKIKEHEEAVRERALADQRRRFEAEALRRSLAEQKEHAAALGRKNRELEHIRAQLEESNARLAEVDRRKDEFIAVLAHELRNPLAAMMAGVEVLQTDSERADPVRLGAVMRRQGEHLIRLIDDLLDISRIASGKMKLHRSLVRAKDILEDAVGLAAAAIETRKHQLELDCEGGEDCVVDGDPVRLAQIVANLLSNAARYTDRGGRIRLAAAREDGQLRIRVVDDGRGLSPELASRVFDMFVQGEGGGGGLGIGLTLVRQLAEMHGGSVSARSDGPGKGSEFEVCLPLASGEAPEAAPGEEASFDGERFRVALIDDHDDVRSMTRLVLEGLGHQVFEAGTGREGIDLIVAERPDVAIVDIGLPDIEGYEVARRLRAELGGDGCPRLIAVTGFGQEQDRERARAAGFDAHLSKPAKTDDLRVAMRNPRQ